MVNDDLSLRVANPQAQPAHRPPQAGSDDFVDQGFHAARDRVIADFERRYLTWLVNQAAGNLSHAARMAGVDRTTLYRLMEKHGLQRETIVVPSD